jgi:hypothetical protein
MINRGGRPRQSWKTLLHYHADRIAAIDLFIVPMVGFKLLHCLVVLGQGRRRLLHHATTAHPAAEWITRQIVEASPGIKRPSSRCEIGMPSIASSGKYQLKR